MQTTPNVDSPDKEDESRKPYHKPELVSYGNIREITRNTGPKGANDGGGGAAAGPKTG
ncbi:MAG TPA: hypothetical protein VFZ22_03270 [Pyrinomonadaceae bacterium]|nr:hypothetical protein [Pyrinomonadaceae bacterium]